ncbi:MAG: DNA repair protein RecO [Bacteroidales bacterium]
MLIKEKGIVLHTSPCSETSRLISIYMANHGKLSFYVKSLHSVKSALKPALFQPLNIIECTYYYKQNRELHYIKEAHSIIGNIYNVSSIKKNTIALFISELLYKTLKYGNPDDQLFLYIETQIKLLFEMNKGYSMYNLLFLSQYLSYLGISPEKNYSSENLFFNIEKGCFVSEKSHNTATKELSYLLYLLFHRNSLDTSLFNREKRYECLIILIKYIKHQLPSVSVIHSLEILNEVFNT